MDRTHALPFLHLYLSGMKLLMERPEICSFQLLFPLSLSPTITILRLFCPIFWKSHGNMLESAISFLQLWKSNKSKMWAEFDGPIYLLILVWHHVVSKYQSSIFSCWSIHYLSVNIFIFLFPSGILLTSGE